MPELTLLSNTPNGTDLRTLAFDQPALDHSTPGQYVKVFLPEEKPGFFALANEPGQPIELLVKASGSVAETLCSMEAGTQVSVSQAQGRGFVVPDSANALLVLATGSGISAVRSLLRAELNAGMPRPVILYYGVLTPEHASWTAELESWEAGGIDVRMVLGQPSRDWTGAQGFVQHAAREAGMLRPGMTAVLCGFPAMIDEFRGMWAEAGLDDAQIITNF